MLVLFLMAGMGLVGFLDDYIKIVKQRSLGLRAKAKMAGQLIVGIAFAVLALQFADVRGNTPASTKLSFVHGLRLVDRPGALRGLGAVHDPRRCPTA